MKSIGIRILRSKVRGFQAEGISIHKRIRKSFGDKRNELWQQKRELGHHARIHLIAYGLLRGIPYNKIEQPAEGNEICLQAVFDMMKAHAEWPLSGKITGEYVENLLKKVPLVEEIKPEFEPKKKGIVDRIKSVLGATL
jgi:hypothetical protein